MASLGRCGNPFRRCPFCTRYVSLAGKYWMMGWPHEYTTEMIGTCKICGIEAESVVHALLRCPHAKALRERPWDTIGVRMRNSCFVDIRSGAAHHVKRIFLKIELFLLWRINLAYQVRCVLQALSFFVHKNLLGWRPYLATPCTPPPHFVALFLAATVCGEICLSFIR